MSAERSLRETVRQHFNSSGLNPVFLGACALALALFAGVFLYFLFHYAPKSHDELLAEPPAKPMVTQPWVEQLLDEEATPDSDVIRPVSQPDDRTLARVRSTSHPLASPFSEVVNETISVYHREVRDLPENLAQREPVAADETDFLAKAAGPSQAILPSRVLPALSPYTLSASTFIPATLVTAINSDLPGSIIARVRRSVYDSKTGNYLLVPQGSTLIGHYNSAIITGQNRALIVWQRLIFPDSSSIDLRGQPGTDLIGQSGLRDTVDNHYGRLMSTALMFSAFGTLGQLSQPQSGGDYLTTQQILFASVGAQMAQAATKAIRQQLDVKPTIRIRKGTAFNVLLTKDMVFTDSYHGG